MSLRISTIVKILIGALCCSCAAMNHVRIEEGTYLPATIDKYSDEVRAGFAALKQGDNDGAAKRFRAALAIPMDEVPNYELMIPLAFSECRAGNRQGGKELLKDAKCMLNVESKKFGCTAQKSIFIEQGGTSRCYEMMCGEMYLPYYESPTNDQVQHVSALEQDLHKASAICNSRKAG